MSTPPTAAPEPGAADASAVELEVVFVAEDESQPLDDVLFASLEPAAGQQALLAVRQAALALGARVLGAAGAVHVLGGMPLRAIVGLGPRAEITLETLRRAAGHAVGCATDLRRAALAIEVPSGLPPTLAEHAAVQVIAEGALLAAHARAPRSTVTRKPDSTLPPRRCVLRLPSSNGPVDLELDLSLTAHAANPPPPLGTAQERAPPPSPTAPPSASGQSTTLSGGASPAPPGESPTPSGMAQPSPPGDSPTPSGMAQPSPPGDSPTPSSMAQPSPPGDSPTPSSMAQPSPPGESPTPSGMAQPSPPGDSPTPSGMAQPSPTGESPTPSGMAQPSPPGESPTPSGMAQPSPPGDGPTPSGMAQPSPPGDGPTPSGIAPTGLSGPSGHGVTPPPRHPGEGAQARAVSLRRARAHAEAVALARVLADAPANHLSPVQLAEQAAAAAQPLGVTSVILGPRELEQLGAGLLLAVGAGSARPPALGVLRYAPPGAARHVAVVGKGITFDAGGISIKPAKGMGDMVHDKAGAAAAAAIIFGAALLELPIALTALLACAENLPSGAAYRPGDVLRGLDGATVEVIDTDAEGRLVLADALTYAIRLEQPRPVDALVDLATLTGSIVSALGNEAAGLFANDDDLARRMLEAAHLAGEPLWRMPILAGHRAQLKSERADRKQCADRWGDCAIAAAFLEMYVDKRPWLHLDIAGVAYNEGSPEWPPYHPKSGAAGAGVRTVLHFLEALCAPAGLT